MLSTSLLSLPDHTVCSVFPNPLPRIKVPVSPDAEMFEKGLWLRVRELAVVRHVAFTIYGRMVVGFRALGL